MIFVYDPVYNPESGNYEVEIASTSDTTDLPEPMDRSVTPHSSRVLFLINDSSPESLAEGIVMMIEQYPLPPVLQKEFPHFYVQMQGSLETYFDSLLKHGVTERDTTLECAVQMILNNFKQMADPTNVTETRELLRNLGGRPDTLKICFISTMLAMKYQEDTPFNNKSFAYCAGIETEGINHMERAMLKYKHFQMRVLAPPVVSANQSMHTEHTALLSGIPGTAPTITVRSRNPSLESNASSSSSTNSSSTASGLSSPSNKDSPKSS